MRGWQVPTYPLPANLQDVIIHRYVIRADMGMNMAQELAEDLQQAIKELSETNTTMHPKDKHDVQGFTH